MRPKHPLFDAPQWINGLAAKCRDGPRSWTAALPAIFPTLFGLGSNLAHVPEELRAQPEVPDQRAKPLGIDLRVTCRCCQTLMPKEGLDVTQVGSALVEQQRRGCMPQGMGGNDRHPSAFAGELDPGVERLIAKGRAVPARKDERRSREVDSPTPKPHALDTFQESEPFLERIRQFLCDGKSRKELPLTWRRAAIIIPPGSRTSRSMVSRAHS